MMKTNLMRLLSLGLLIALLVSSQPGMPVRASDPNWQDKVDPWILAQLTEGEINFLVLMADQADLSPAAALKSKSAKGEFVYQTLSKFAAQSQAPLLAQLESWGVTYQSFWVANMIAVRGDLGLVRTLAARADVGYLYPDPQIRTALPQPEPLPAAPQVDIPLWNLTLINADDVWAAGYTGQGIVIGGQDTGYIWEHPALKERYRGWDGATADHDYNWFDATADASPVPVDPYVTTHGTHTMGTMVGGSDGSGNLIGVAPGAKWIGCRNMDASGYGSPATYTACYQWFIAPYPVGGDPFTDGDPTKAPDVINNSWSCPGYEGCDAETLRAVVKAVHAAGIVTVHSAGNSGPGCSTVNTPAAIYPESFTVGSVNSSDVIATSSSRGPVTVDGSNLRKPNVSAPGVGIYSSYKNDSYTTMSGTSMAAPHVAGTVALLFSAMPSLKGQPELVETLIEQTAFPQYSTDGCGGDTSSSHPNNTYGWGRIDAEKAYRNLPINLTVSNTTAHPGSVLTYTLTITNHNPISPTNNVIITDKVPAGTDFITATTPHTKIGDTIQWDFAALPAGSSQQVELVVQVPLTTTAGIITNDAYLWDSDEIAPLTGNPVETIVHVLSLDKNVSDPVILAGNTLTYTLTVTNLQTFTTTHNLLLTDTLPANTTFITATLPFTRNADLITWTKPSLGPLDSWEVELIIGVNITATGAITNNRYGVLSAETDAFRGDPVVTVISESKVSFLPYSSSVFSEPGSTITHQFQLTNLDNYTDTFLLTLDSILGWSGITETVVTLEAGESQFISVLVLVPEDAADGIFDTATLSAVSTYDDEIRAAATAITQVFYHYWIPLIPAGEP